LQAMWCPTTGEERLKRERKKGGGTILCSYFVREDVWRKRSVGAICETSSGEQCGGGGVSKKTKAVRIVNMKSR